MNGNPSSCLDPMPKMILQNLPTITLPLSNRLNVDADGGRGAHYDALDSGDEAVKDDVVTDAESEVDDWPSDASAVDESDSDPKQDAMDIALVKEFLDEIGGSDAILVGHLKAETLKEFSYTGCGSIQ
ncbi:hypothetical protein PHMEG_00023136 [Phytophthora megakarya]|uniref:Uncharacterized protein n=1 Tax=Phytophthora megakarya TaxID=4795 RepID=A0A225VHS8_9STRA|nr:hypothetical protein PHMEG_00023136 [Phytophthora megakarya]